MLELLLSSRVRARVLTALFLSPGVERNAWELSQKLQESYSAIWKELNRLESVGILTSQMRGNSKAYQVNQNCSIAPELSAIVQKTEGVGKVIGDYLKRSGGVEVAFIYGSFASGKADAQSDIDLMLIGEVNLGELSDVVNAIEDTLNRPINYVVFSKEEWQEKLLRAEAFAVNVENSPKVWLIGGPDGIRTADSIGQNTSL